VEFQHDPFYLSRENTPEVKTWELDLFGKKVGAGYDNTRVHIVSLKKDVSRECVVELRHRDDIPYGKVCKPATIMRSPLKMIFILV